MSKGLTEKEFHEAWCNTPFHHAPQGYWNRIHEKRKNHKNVGRKAYVNGKILTCKESEDNLVVFENNVNLSDGSISYGEIIISGEDVNNIKWMEE